MVYINLSLCMSNSSIIIIYHTNYILVYKFILLKIYLEMAIINTVASQVLKFLNKVIMI